MSSCERKSGQLVKNNPIVLEKVVINESPGIKVPVNGFYKYKYKVKRYTKGVVSFVYLDDYYSKDDTIFVDVKLFR